MKRFIIMTVILAWITAGLFANGTNEDPTPTQTSDFSGYSSWTKVNSKTITGDMFGVLGGAHERAKGFREIFVNSTGKPVEFGEAPYPFPAGTIIVKESYKNNNGKKGALSNLTVMVKREKGYSEKYGDWEFILANADGKIKTQGPLRSCITCHSKSKGKDYTFFNAKM